MAKLFVSLMVSLDGFFEGPNHELDWHLTGGAFDEYCDEMLDATDVLVMGRRSYEMMIAYWPIMQSRPMETCSWAEMFEP